MTEYKQIKCVKCNKCFSTTAKDKYKCNYCNNTKGNIVLATSERPLEIIEAVAQYNYKNRG